jgi:hypothetical protein
MAQWKVDDAGCYADGALGHDHVRHVLADLVRELGHDALAEELRYDMSDDASEELDALEVLNAECDGCYFEVSDGDLVLFPESEEV